MQEIDKVTWRRRQSVTRISGSREKPRIATKTTRERNEEKEDREKN